MVIKQNTSGMPGSAPQYQHRETRKTWSQRLLSLWLHHTMKRSYVSTRKALDKADDAELARLGFGEGDAGRLASEIDRLAHAIKERIVKP